VRASRSNLTRQEIQQAFASDAGVAFPVILSPRQLAELVGLSAKTIYEWLAKGRLDDAYRKRGKHVLIWRDRAIEILFSGKEWSDD
jgi:excisionase family DNA binding protein